MKEVKNTMQGEVSPSAEVSRRKFLGYAGIAGAGLFVASCKKEENVVTEAGATDLGTNDDGLLNLMFVIQQVEAGFYEALLKNKYAGITSEEEAYFEEMLNHEIAHRELLRNYLAGKGTVVTTNFSDVKFAVRSSVMDNAELIENLAVATLNEAGRLFVAGEHVSIAAKMASLEARQAATISNMRSVGNFFGTVDVAGLEQGSLPSNTVTTINRFLSTKVSGNNLPNM
ncbi:MAG: ferritin-like domain-containing protein [Taibaiella sp.]|nr:ferritin-like domain-containing protein [Taibaiella sp.]